MARMKNPIYAQIALEVGGAHYPEVGGELLEKFGDALVKQCAKLAAEETSLPYNTYSEKIKKTFGVNE